MNVLNIVCPVLDRSLKCLILLDNVSPLADVDTVQELSDILLLYCRRLLNESRYRETIKFYVIVNDHETVIQQI